MAQTKWYSWSNIRYGADRDTTDPNIITAYHEVKPGEVVSAKKLDLTDEQFKELIESGAVRSSPYPNVPATWTGSPVEWFREQARRAASGVYDNAALSDAATFDANMGVDASSGQALVPDDDADDDNPPDE